MTNHEINFIKNSTCESSHALKSRDKKNLIIESNDSKQD
jgi:hypothetical protein